MRWLVDGIRGSRRSRVQALGLGVLGFEENFSSPWQVPSTPPLYLTQWTRSSTVEERGPTNQPKRVGSEGSLETPVEGVWGQGGCVDGIDWGSSREPTGETTHHSPKEKGKDKVWGGKGRVPHPPTPSRFVSQNNNSEIQKPITKKTYLVSFLLFLLCLRNLRQIPSPHPFNSPKGSPDRGRNDPGRPGVPTERTPFLIFSVRPLGPHNPLGLT